MLDGGQNFGSCQHDLYCDTDTAHYFLLIWNNLLSELVAVCCRQAGV